MTHSGLSLLGDFLDVQVDNRHREIEQFCRLINLQDILESLEGDWYQLSPAATMWPHVVTVPVLYTV